MEVYLKVKEHLFYRIKTKEVLAINTNTNSFHKSKCLPTAYIQDITVITKNDFKNALKQIGLDGELN